MNNTDRKPWWQQATALVTVSASGAITGFNFAPAAAAKTTPTSVPLHLLALEQAALPDTAGKTPASDAQLRAAIVNVAGYYLKLAKTKTPAQVEALIWGKVSGEGTDHGPSCAAFASLTLELAAQTTGLRSWVTGGTTYPWPLPAWADVRVDTNPASPLVTSVVADAQAHGRWHPLSDGYIPQPGDWAVYDGHVEVVTSYSGGVLDTIGADSLPGFTLNAHSSAAPLAEQGIAGFVDNGNLQPASGSTAPRANTKAAPAKAKPAATATVTVPGLLGGVALAGTGGIPGAGPGAGKAGTGESARGAVPGVLATGQLLGEPAASPKSAPAKRSRPSTTPPAASPSGSSASSSSEAARHPGDAGPAGIHQPDRAGRGRRPAALRRTRIGDDRPGDRRVRLGSEQPCGSLSQPVRHQGGRTRWKRHPADSGIRERQLGHHRRTVRHLPQ